MSTPDGQGLERLAALLLESNNWTTGVKLNQKFTGREARLMAEWLLARGVSLPDSGDAPREKGCICGPYRDVATEDHSAVCYGLNRGTFQNRRVGDAVHDGTPLRGLGEASVPSPAPPDGLRETPEDQT
jgi:hypothetical protein